MPAGFFNPNFANEAGELLQLGHWEEEPIVDNEVPPMYISMGQYQ